MRGENHQTERPRAWAGALVAAVVLAVLAVACLTLAVYEYNNWQAPVHRGIPQDYSPDTYMAAMLISGVVGLLAILGLYFVAHRWRTDRGAGAPERERI